MKIKTLVVSNMFPDVDVNYPYAGVFVKEQISAISKNTPVEVDFFLIRGFRGKIFYLYDTIRLLIHICKNSYDLVHFHYGLSALAVFFKPVFHRFPKVVVTFHGGDILPRQGKSVQVAISRAIAKRCDYLICLSDEMENEFVGVNVPKAIIPCGVDFDLFYPSEVKDDCLVIFPGDKNRKVKNFPYFEQVINILKNKIPSLSYQELHGLERNQVAALMRKSTAIFMTSISEGSPQSIKEALATDLAVVSTDVGDVKSTCAGTVGTAVLDKGMSAEKVANILEKTIQDAKASPGSRRKHASEIFLDNSDISRRVFAVYEEVLR